MINNNLSLVSDVFKSENTLAGACTFKPQKCWSRAPSTTCTQPVIATNQSFLALVPVVEWSRHCKTIFLVTQLAILVEIDLFMLVEMTSDLVTFTTKLDTTSSILNRIRRSTYIIASPFHGDYRNAIRYDGINWFMCSPLVRRYSSIVPYFDHHRRYTNH